MADLESLLDSAGLKIVRRDVGGGGSATVHECRVEVPSAQLPAVGSKLAAKEYKPDILRVPNQLSRIRQEAQVGALLQHPNIVRTFGLLGDTGNDVTASNRPVVLLLEWIEGNTLDAWYRDLPKPLAWDTLRSIARNLTSALGELHAKGVFHRDIKPENVMIRLSDS